MERASKQKEENGHGDKEEEIFYSPNSMEEKHEEFESNSDEENKKVDQLRDIVGKQDPACKEVDEVALRRFLRARDLDIEKASKMLMKYLTWRRKFVPTGSISASETPNHIAHSKVFLQGRDRRGCPVAVIFGAKHFP